MLDWLTVTLCVIPAYFLQTTIHEGAHAIFGLLQGLEIEHFKVWPHRGNRQRFYWGSVRFFQPKTVTLSDAENAWRAAAPFVVSGALWTVNFAVIGNWAPFPSRILMSVLAVFWTAQTIDLVRGFLLAWWGSDFADINKAGTYGKLPKPILRGMATCLSGVLVACWGIELFELVF